MTADSIPAIIDKVKSRPPHRAHAASTAHLITSPNPALANPQAPTHIKCWQMGHVLMPLSLCIHHSSVWNVLLPPSLSQSPGQLLLILQSPNKKDQLLQEAVPKLSTCIWSLSCAPTHTCSPSPPPPSPSYIVR